MSTTTTQTMYTPPPGPPPSRPAAPRDPRPDLLPTPSKLDLQLLATRGWLSLDLNEHPDIRDTYNALFALSEQFFALPDGDAQKTAFAAPSGAQASEEGYSRIPGEKQILTCRSVPRSPEIVRDTVRAAWAASGALMQSAAKDIAHSLNLPPDAYSTFVDPCVTFHEEKTPTLLRMFRYDRPSPGSEPTVVAQPHRDLGMLSLVIGHTPGLDVFEPASPAHPNGRWLSVEEPTDPAGRGLTATLLGGQVLNFLTQGRYTPGVHRVSVRPADDTPFRFSLVFALRPAPAPMHTACFESPQIGPFPPGAQLHGDSMASVFDRIMKSHWNINVTKDIREEQQRKFEERKAEERRAAQEAQKATQVKEEVHIDSLSASPKPKRFSRLLQLVGRKQQM
jgi:isopenicillin N synthase-like dioxygenase